MGAELVATEAGFRFIGIGFCGALGARGECPVTIVLQVLRK